MNAIKPTTNEDLLEIMQSLMQTTSEGFDGLNKRMDRLEGRMDGLEGRMDGVEGRMDGIEGRLKNIEGDVQNLKQASYRHEKHLSQLTDLAQNTHDKLDDLIKIDIKEILSRLAAIEERLPIITEAEIRKLQLEMQMAVDWIAKVSKLKNIAIKFPS